MASVKVQDQAKNLVYTAKVMVLQDTRQHAVEGLGVLFSAINAKEFQKLSLEQKSALAEVRQLLIDLRPKDNAQKA